MSAFAAPTQDVARLVAIIGPEAALTLIEARGGTRLYVAEALNGRTVADIIGLDAAEKLRSEYGATVFKVPLGRAWRVLTYRLRGLSYREMALKAGCSENMVFDVLSRHKMTARQYDLFSGTP